MDGADVDLQDYNEEVIPEITTMNVIANLKGFDRQPRYFCGDWGSLGLPGFPDNACAFPNLHEHELPGFPDNNTCLNLDLLSAASMAKNSPRGPMEIIEDMEDDGLTNSQVVLATRSCAVMCI
jgi:hypothetical protein